MLYYDRSRIARSTVQDSGFIGQPDIASLEPTVERVVSDVLTDFDSGRVGYFDEPDKPIDDLIDWADRKSEKFDTQVVIGIGGSSLGTRAILEANGERAKGLETRVIENVDPVTYASLSAELDVEKTLFTVVTKSGTTVETMSKFSMFYDLVAEKVGESSTSDHFVAVTGTGNDGLHQIARDRGFDVFSIPDNVGGRFSVLSHAGLVPLALAGYAVDELLEGAQRAKPVASNRQIRQNPFAQAAGDIYQLYCRGFDEIVMFAYADRLGGLNEWFRQLWAESLGKCVSEGDEARREGMTPVSAIGAIDQHSQVQLYMEGPNNRQFVFVEVDDHGPSPRIRDNLGVLPEKLSHLRGRALDEILAAECDGTREALAEAGRPVTTWRLRRTSPKAIGAFVLGFEFITSVTGGLLGVNPYNQPGVERGKTLAHEKLQKWGDQTSDAPPQTEGDAPNFWPGGLVVDEKHR